MPWYEYERSNPFRDHAHDRLVEEGEVVELSAEIADNQPGFVQVEPPGEASDPKGSDGEDGVVDPTEYSVSDLKDEVSLSDLSDEERKDMVALEEANKDRSSVTEWLAP